MGYMTNTSLIRNRPSPGLRPLVVLNILTLALMMGLLVWGVVDGWIFDDNSASDMQRMWLEQVSLLAVFLSIVIVWATGWPGASLTGRARRRAAWWDRMYSAIRLAAAENNEGRRSTGLLLLEQLVNDPDATPRDREMLREVVTALKTEAADVTRKWSRDFIGECHALREARDVSHKTASGVKVHSEAPSTKRRSAGRPGDSG